jgi:hypothetical protein
MKLKFKICATFIQDHFYDCDIIKLNMSDKKWKIIVTSPFNKVSKNLNIDFKEFALYIAENDLDYDYTTSSDQFKDGDMMLKTTDYEMYILDDGNISVTFTKYEYYQEAEDFNKCVKHISRKHKLDDLNNFLDD